MKNLLGTLIAACALMFAVTPASATATLDIWFTDSLRLEAPRLHYSHRLFGFVLRPLRSGG